MTFAPKIGSTMRRVWTAVFMLLSPLPTPATLKSPAPSMKNGRFSEKNTGIALVHLHLEGVALHLAEIGVDRGVEGDRRA